jgi:hypothetical protein
MIRYYHSRFFSDTRFTAVAVISLFLVGFWGIPEAFLLVPVVALVGANQTAFDASYIYFARHYSTALEKEINSSMRRRILLASELEDRFLFPLNRRKIVAIGFGNDFTWFGWMTVAYTALGLLAFTAGLGLGWETLVTAGTGWIVFYLVSLFSMTFVSLAVGWWWFVAGVGEKRLSEVLGSRFGVRMSPDNVRPLSR